MLPAKRAGSGTKEVYVSVSNDETGDESTFFHSLSAIAVVMCVVCMRMCVRVCLMREAVLCI